MLHLDTCGGRCCECDMQNTEAGFGKPNTRTKHRYLHHVWLRHRNDQSRQKHFGRAFVLGQAACITEVMM